MTEQKLQASSQRPKRVVLFSYHSIGFSARKNSIVFWAEKLAEIGWQVDFVTTQLSLLSVLASVPRLSNIPRHQRNRWIAQSHDLSSFIWVPMIPIIILLVL